MEDPRCFHHYSTTTISPHLFARSLENKRSRISRWILIQRSPGIESALDYRAMYCIPDSKVETEGRGSVLIPERLAFYCCYYYCYRWLRRIWMSKSEISKIFSPFFSLLSLSLVSFLCCLASFLRWSKNTCRETYKDVNRERERKYPSVSNIYLKSVGK